MIKKEENNNNDFEDDLDDDLDIDDDLKSEMGESERGMSGTFYLDDRDLSILGNSTDNLIR